MGLSPSPEAAAALDRLDPELRGAAHAMGMAMAVHLQKLRPAVATAGDAVVESLSLDHEGEPDALSLVACLAAHDAYVRRRGTADGLSTGALALARLMVWAERAALLGPAPRIVWMGPEARRPESATGRTLAADCAVTADGRRRRARAIAVVATA